MLDHMKNEPFRSHCPINFALHIFGDKWSLLIIRDLMFKQKSYYGEFLDAEEGISTNILADRLVKLERFKLICKETDHVKKSKVKYSLTQKGIDLLPMLLEIIAWSAQYDNKTAAPKEFIRQLKSNRKKVEKQIIENLKCDSKFK